MENTLGFRLSYSYYTWSDESQSRRIRVGNSWMCEQGERKGGVRKEMGGRGRRGARGQGEGGSVRHEAGGGRI